MNDLYTKYLCQKYSYIFDGSDTYDFSCEDGWFCLLDASFSKIKYIDKKKLFRAEQIKEKFGTLRVYYEPYIDKFNKILLKAEVVSGKICELCGKNGYLCNNGWWYKTLCEHCCKQTGYKKATKR